MFANRPARFLLGQGSDSQDRTWQEFCLRTSLGDLGLPNGNVRFAAVDLDTPSGVLPVEIVVTVGNGARFVFLTESLPRFLELPWPDSPLPETGLVLLDDRKSIQWVSHSASGLLGNPEWKQGQPFAAFIRSCSAEDVAPGDLLARSHPEPAHLFIRGRHIQLRPIPLVFPVESGGFLIQLQDVSALERLQQQERLARIGELAAAAVHEIKNPLTTIRGFLQLLGEQGGIDNDYLHIILNEIDRVTALIADLLALSRPAASSPCDPSRVVKEVVALLQAEYNLHHIRVDTELPDSLPPLEIAASELKQVLLNLIQNALDALGDSPDGRILILAETLETKAHLHVRDNGPGIPDDHVSTIFQPFFTTKSQGTGLGLSVCKQILEQSGGTLTLSHSSQGDTCFTLTIPRAVS